MDLPAIVLKNSGLCGIIHIQRCLFVVKGLAVLDGEVAVPYSCNPL